MIAGAAFDAIETEQSIALVMDKRQPEFIGNPNPAFDCLAFKPFGAIAIVMNIVIANLFFDIFNKDTNRSFIGYKEITDRRLVADIRAK